MTQAQVQVMTWAVRCRSWLGPSDAGNDLGRQVQVMTQAVRCRSWLGPSGAGHGHDLGRQVPVMTWAVRCRSWSRPSGACHNLGCCENAITFFFYPTPRPRTFTSYYGNKICQSATHKSTCDTNDTDRSLRGLADIKQVVEQRLASVLGKHVKLFQGQHNCFATMTACKNMTLYMNDNMTLYMNMIIIMETFHLHLKPLDQILSTSIWIIMINDWSVWSVQSISMINTV